MLPDDLELRLCTSTADIADFFDWLKRPREVLGFDTETTGLSPERDYIRMIQFGDEHMGWAIPWQDWRGLAREVLDTYDGTLVAHNSKFDIRQIYNDFQRKVSSWPWHRTHDTMGMAHINDSQRPKGLKQLGDKLIDRRISQAQKTLDEGMRANGWTWETVPLNFHPYWQYGALDPVITVFIYKKLKEMGTIDPQLYDIEMGAVRVAASMEETGFLIDKNYCVDMAARLDRYSQSVRDWLYTEWNLDNPTPMRLVKFFQEQGVKLIDKQTNSGRQAMDKHVLQTTDHEVARQVLNLRKYEKLSGTYLHNFLDMVDDQSLLHATINPMAARTGRMSISDPSLQNLPRKDPIVRSAFIPRPGHKLLTIDADQIEARLTAHFSNDQGLIEAFNSPDDFFCTIASQIFGYPVVKGMTERDLTKGVTYGKVYGASVMKMAETAGVPPEQMQKTNALFDTNFHRVHEFMAEVINEGKRRRAESDDNRGYVVTPYHRKLRADSGREYTLVNYLIQCHASEILKRKIVELDAVLPDEVKMIIPIHDEVIFDVPEDSIHEIKELAEGVLNESSEYRVPLTWGGDICESSWGSKYGKVTLK